MVLSRTFRGAPRCTTASQKSSQAAHENSKGTDATQQERLQSNQSATHSNSQWSGSWVMFINDHNNVAMTMKIQFLHLPSALVSQRVWKNRQRERGMGGRLTNDKAPMALQEWLRTPGEGAGSRCHYHNSHLSPSSPPHLPPPPSPHTPGHTRGNTLSTPTQTIYIYTVVHKVTDTQITQVLYSGFPFH